MTRRVLWFKGFWNHWFSAIIFTPIPTVSCYLCCDQHYVFASLSSQFFPALCPAGIKPLLWNSTSTHEDALASPSVGFLMCWDITSNLLVTYNGNYVMDRQTSVLDEILYWQIIPVQSQKDNNPATGLGMWCSLAKHQVLEEPASPSSSKTLIPIYRTTQHHIPHSCDLNIHHYDNLKPCLLLANSKLVEPFISFNLLQKQNQTDCIKWQDAMWYGKWLLKS